MTPKLASVLFVAIFVYRYLRLIVGIFANLTYKAYPVLTYPTYRPADAAVIIPTTLKHPSELTRCLKSIYACNPAKIFVVGAESSVPEIEQMCVLLSLQNVEVLAVEHLNKRRQLLRALGLVNSEIVVFADDNVVWPEGYLDHLLAIFEDAAVGAGGTRQRVRRARKPDIWNFLAIGYLERRVFNNITTQAIDGSISTLSGRTAAYRTKILKNDQFMHYFLNDSWFGRKLNSDDDKCLTRFVYSNGWKIALQQSAVIETSMEDGWKYIEQCKRWARGHWRGNFIVMTNERYWYSPRYLWGFYAIYLAQFQTPAILVDGILLYLLKNSLNGDENDKYVLGIFFSWILFTKLVKLIPHFIAHPSDLIFIPASLLFSYLHGIINVYALMTLHVTAWGSQQLVELEQAKDGEGSVACLAEMLAGAEDSGQVSEQDAA